ncbi:zinc ribbon domain-containing protein [bacterium BFN5]|nr:zinc ribbon domain-containing protein [bacterium BFN5]
MAFCSGCGKEILESEQFCSKCGKPSLSNDATKIEVPVLSPEKKMSTKKQGCFGCLGLIILLIVIGTIFGNSSKTSQPTSNSSTTQSQAKADLELVEHKAINEGSLSYVTGTVKNNTKKNYGYVQVEVNLYDESDAQVGSTLANTNNLEPGGVWKFKALVMQKGNYKYKIKNISGF